MDPKIMSFGHGKTPEGSCERPPGAWGAPGLILAPQVNALAISIANAAINFLFDSTIKALDHAAI
jgi:hypothetical protein